jgi:hypothetical protein
MRFPTLLITLVATLSMTMLAQAEVDDAHSYAMEAAEPFMKERFTVREDYWNGEVLSGQKLMVKHQLFKGNDYAFWLGTSNDDCKLEVQVLDAKGNATHITPEIGVGKNFTSVRVTPSASGMYSVIFSVTSKREKGVFWALAYGFR